MNFQTSYRVFYEDTDAAGVVYHANYLKFAERARTDWLRGLGWSQNKLMLEEQVIFPVYELSIKFFKPAVLDDVLTVTVELIEISYVTMRILQKIFKQEVLIATIDVGIASCNLDKKPVKFPKDIFNILKR